MKLLIASDLHGSYYYCSKIIESFERLNVDKLILLGDILYHGARNPLPKDYSPKETLTLLNNYSSKVLAVKGNCDSSVDQLVLDFDLESIYRVEYVDNRVFFLTHGDILSPENMPKLLEGDVFISGHTHIVEASCKNGIHILNPGSLSLPKSELSSYIVYEDEEFLFFNENDQIVLEYRIH